MTRAEKISATKKARAARLASQTITIDPNWRIIRFDPWNWQIQHHTKFCGYYGTLLAAFQALPAAMLEAEAKNTLADVLECQRAINERIAIALKLKLA